jgi:hypothetical protein
MATQTQTTTANSDLLRRALLADGLISGGTGVLCLLASRPIAALMGLTNLTFLTVASLIMVVYGFSLLWLTPRVASLRQFGKLVIGGNIVWVAASILVLVTNWQNLATVGNWIVLLQADVVLVLTIAQWLGVRRRRA